MLNSKFCEGNPPILQINDIRYLSIYLFIYLFDQFIYLLIYLFIYFLISLFIYLFIYLLINLFIFYFLFFYIYLFFILFINSLYIIHGQSDFFDIERFKFFVRLKTQLLVFISIWL